MDGERILEWLTSQVSDLLPVFYTSIQGNDIVGHVHIFYQDVFETKDEIEEVNRKLLEKLLDENEFVAVYFCKFALDRNLM